MLYPHILSGRRCLAKTQGAISRTGCCEEVLPLITEPLPAVRLLDNAYNQFQLPRYWGDTKHAAADGTQWNLYENNLLSERHIRYGGYGGVAYYHVSDAYIALFSHFIPCGAWEAIYILNGLTKNKSDIQPDVLHGDTQAQSAPVYGLSFLLGISLMPRIRNGKT
jgi:TnpA family transposase